MKGLNGKSVLAGAVILYLLQRFVAPKVPALGVLKP